jgi:hypothetical protein
MTVERLESRHVSVWINTGPAEAYTYLADPRNLPHWAAGLASGEVESVDGQWKVSSPMGEITVAFAATNDLGVLDHVVGLPDGESFYNPMRVLPAGDDAGWCEVLFTVRRRPGMTDEELAADVAAVTADLEQVRRILG